MSKNCNYVYVQGLRFRPQSVTVLWKDAKGVEHHVQLRKTGTGFAQFSENGIPLSVTPKDLKKMLRKGETINVIVHAMSESSTEYEKVMLRLDPRQAEGRKGRRAFDAESLAGMPPRGRRALALEQLKTAPYGAENRDQAVERILWGLENLDDAAIAQMLAEAEVGYTSRSSTNEELAALLLSDDALVGALMRDGKHESLRGLLQIAPLAMATLAGTSRPADEVLADAAREMVGDGVGPAGDPAIYVHAVRYVTDPVVLNNLAFDRNPKVRVEALKSFKEIAPTGASDSLLKTVAIMDSDPAVRVEAVSLVSSDQLEGIIKESCRDASPVVFAATFERLRRSEFDDEDAVSYLRGVVEETLYGVEMDVTGHYQRSLRTGEDRPSDAVLEYLLTGPVDVLAGKSFSRPDFTRSVVSAIVDPTVLMRVAGNTAVAADIRAAAAAGIVDDQERAWFTDPIHPTEVRCAAIRGTTGSGRGKPRPLAQRRIIELARDHDPAVRRAAATKLRDASMLKEMVTRDKDAAARAAESLLEMSRQDPTVLADLLEALSTSLSRETFDEADRGRLVYVAVEAAQGLEENDAQAIADVARRAQAPDVRWGAVDAMTRSLKTAYPEMTAIYQKTLIEVVTKDADATNRALAASGIRDQKVLSDLLGTSSDEAVRTTLISNVVNIEVLANTVQNDPSPSTRKAAVERCRLVSGSSAGARDVLHAAAKGDSDPEVRKAALGSDIDQSVCVEVARSDADPTVRSRAVAFIRSRDVLADIATKDADPQVRADALECYNSI